MYERFTDSAPAEASRNVRAQTSAWSILRNDPVFKAIMQETEYEFAERWKDLVKKDISGSDIHRVERDMLTKFVEMLAMYGYTINRMPVNEAEDPCGGLQTPIVCSASSIAGSLSAVTEWARTSVELGSDVGDTKEAIRKEMISTVVENVKHFKHALTVEELIDAPKIEGWQSVSVDNETGTIKQTTCTCKSLLNGHENGCPFAPK